MHAFQKECKEAESINVKSNVFAGVVQTNGINLKTAKVVVLATGTKHIDADALYEQEASLPDTHAEVVARRCLLYYFYKQLELFFIPGVYLYF